MTAVTDILHYRHVSKTERVPSFLLLRAFAGESKHIMRFAITWIVSAVIVYLIAVYSLFGLSVSLQQNVSVIGNLTESNKILELDLQQKHTQFSRDNGEILQTMEKISDLKYVLPTDTSVSRANMSN